MPRLILRDDRYRRVEAMLSGEAGDRGVTAKNNRLFVDAVPWVARTGAPWHDLPKTFGPWNSAYCDLRAGRIAASGIVSPRNWR